MNIGIMGLGSIAHTMAKTLLKMKDEGIVLKACASRKLDKALAFSRKFHVQKAYGSYEELVADESIDLIYIATPHSEHYKNALLCINGGKNALVEKAFTTDHLKAEEMFKKAENRKVLLTEAIWTRYMPSRRIIDELISSKIIGDIYYVYADLGYLISHHNRLTDPALAGGALLDVGIYPLNFAQMVFHETPSKINTIANMYKTGVDATSSYDLSYSGNKLASLSSSMVCLTSRRGIISGDKGFIEVKNINNPEQIKVFDQNRRLIRKIKIPKQISGYEYEIRECKKAIEEHSLECPSMPHKDSIDMMKIYDEIRKQIGVVYPFEK